MLSYAYECFNSLSKVVSEHSSLEERPAIENTTMRRAITYSQQLFFPSGKQDFGSLATISLAFPTVVVAVISALSILCRVVPWLGPFLQKNKFWPLAMIQFILAILLGQDTYVNHWRHPLRYGLYWNGYIQSLVTFGCLLSSTVLMNRALGRVPRLSNQRKAAAALSGSLATLAVPLALCSIHEKQRNMPTWKFLGSMAFLSLVSGIYFLGCNIRRLTLAKIPIGECIYQWSLIPVKVAHWVLWVLGDFGHYTIQPLGWFAVKVAAEGIWIVKDKTIRFWRVSVAPAILIATRCLLRVLCCFTSVLCECTYLLKKWMTSWIVQSIIQAIFSVCSYLQNKALEPLCNSCYHVLQALAVWLKQIENGLVVVFQFAINSIILPTCRVGYLGLKAFNQYCNHFLRVIGQKLMHCGLEFQRGFKVYCDVFVPYLCNTGNWLLSVINLLCRSVIIPMFWAGVRGIKALWRILDFSLTAAREHQSVCFHYIKITIYQNTEWTVPFLRAFHRQLLVLISRCWRIVANYLFPFFRCIWLLVRIATMTVMGAFLKKYWQLIPAGLVLNGSFLYARAALAGIGGGGGLAQVEYALGSWCLFLIGSTVLHTVAYSPGSLVNQRVVLQESILQYVDLHLWFALSQIVVSGWHALSTALGLLLRGWDFFIRKSLNGVWQLLTLLLKHFWKPLCRLIRVVIKRIWTSPYWSMLASLSALWLLSYLHKTERFSIGLSPSLKGFVWTLYELLRDNSHMEQFSRLCSVFGRVLRPATKLVANVMYSNIYEPLILDVEVTSPSAALWCWLVTCLVTKTRSRIRIKMLSVPTVIFYTITGVKAIALIRASVVILFIWGIMSILVDYYEEREGIIVQGEFASFRHHHRARMRQRRSTPVQASDPLFDIHSSQFEQTDCSICLEVFEPGNSRLLTLPCGHTFHGVCVQEWLNQLSSHQRCPICRRAIGGAGRFLEVLF